MLKQLIWVFLCLNIGCVKQPPKSAKLTVAAKAVHCSSSRYDLVHDKAPVSQQLPDLDTVKLIVPQFEPKSPRGNPKTYEVLGKKYSVMPSSYGYKEDGLASWYGQKFHGFDTSNGEKYDMFAMSAAHKSLPLPTYLRVTNLENNKNVVVKVNDRGPFHANRIIDLSYAAAHKLDMLAKGTTRVKIEAIHDFEHHYLQAATFKDRQNAEKFKVKLSKIFEHDIKINVKSDNTLHTVDVGPLHESEIMPIFMQFLQHKLPIPIQKVAKVSAKKA